MRVPIDLLLDKLVQTTVRPERARRAIPVDDDPRARDHYNRIVDLRTLPAPRPFATSEPMRRRDLQYRLGIVVGYNEARRPGAGSCIFLHVWNGARPTSGCTAMPERALRRLARWLDPAARPLLVQLTRAQWRAQRARLLHAARR